MAKGTGQHKEKKKLKKDKKPKVATSLSNKTPPRWRGF